MPAKAPLSHRPIFTATAGAAVAFLIWLDILSRALVCTAIGAALGAAVGIAARAASVRAEKSHGHGGVFEGEDAGREDTRYRRMRDDIVHKVRKELHVNNEALADSVCDIVQTVEEDVDKLLQRHMDHGSDQLRRFMEARAGESLSQIQSTVEEVLLEMYSAMEKQLNQLEELTMGHFAHLQRIRTEELTTQHLAYSENGPARQPGNGPPKDPVHTEYRAPPSNLR
jgi:hypothetical protein